MMHMPKLRRESYSGVPEFAAAAADGTFDAATSSQTCAQVLHSSRTMLKLTDCDASCHDNTTFFTHTVAHPRGGSDSIVKDVVMLGRSFIPQAQHTRLAHT